MRTETVVTFEDFEAVVISCPNCKSELALRLQGETTRPAGATFAPRLCGVCGASLNVDMAELERFQRICREFAALKQVSLRIRRQD